MKILVKYPTRERPYQFHSTLINTFLMARDKKNIQFIVSIDNDDDYFDKSNIEVLESMMPVKIYGGISKNKIAACNRDIEKATHWDIVLLLSDDMIPQIVGWDDEIRKAFGNNLDQNVHFNDGYVNQKLQTLLIYGRDYYNRFKYLYNESYVSLFADNESQEVSQILGKYKHVPACLFKHEHYSNVKGMAMDGLMIKNEAYYNRDRQIYNSRKSNRFGLTNEMIEEAKGLVK